MSARIGVVGARGHVGGELLALIAGHPGLSLAHVASRQFAGEPVQALAAGLQVDLAIDAPDPEAAAGAGLDVCLAALPNGLSAPFVEAFERRRPQCVVVDLSADHRFEEGWIYGLPELHRDALRGARRIANPGCYATAVQLALAPLGPHLAGPASAFGLSGYSGAGTTPGPRNDAARLADSVMAYTLAGHGHEREIRRHLGAAVNFTPHVAGFFRGLMATVQAPLDAPMDTGAVRALFARAYQGEPLVRLQDAPPEIAQARGQLGALVGGVTAAPDERRAVVVCALDNLLKGAASQAIQNVNLALGLPETQGLARALSRETEKAG